MNIPYEMFLTIQMHLTCRKDRIHNRLQAKKNEDLFRRTSDDSLKTKDNMMSAVTSLMQNLPATKKKGNTSSRRMMSRMQYRHMKRILQFHHAVDGNIVQGKIHSMRPLTKRRPRLRRDICRQ